MTFRARAGQVAQSIGIDRAIFATLMARGWAVGAGLATVVFVTRLLTPELQGYYYTFGSLAALQVFAEMGLNFAIIQFASHEMARLTWTTEGTVYGDEKAKQRLRSLLLFALTWFSVAAAILVVVLVPVGLSFFGKTRDGGLPLPTVLTPWVVLVFATSAALVVNAALAILEGCGQIAQTATIRLWQSVFGTAAALATLSFGGGLYALGVNALTALLIGSSWLIKKRWVFFVDLHRHQSAEHRMNWRTEVWPFQWRIAISWISGYLIFQLFNPLLFAMHGPVAAGRMGVSLQVISAINSAAIVWITTKAPTFGKLVADRRWKELDTLFTRALAQSSVALFLGVGCAISLSLYLSLSGSDYASRLLEPRLIALLCVVCVSNHVVFAEASYLRAFKREPFMGLSVLSGLATAGLSFLLVPSLGTSGAVYAYTAIATGIGLVGGTAIFVKRRREWTKVPILSATIQNNETV